MLATFARNTQLLELALDAILVAVLVRIFGWSCPAAIAGAVGVSLGFRAALCLAMFALGWWWRSPRAFLGVAGTLRLVGREFVAILRFNLVDMPWETHRVRPDPTPRVLEHPPVVLIHGYCANRGCFRPVVARLDAEAVGPVFVPNFPSFHTDIAEYVEALHVYLEALCAATGQKVVLVAHSMGGLVARAYRARHGESRIAFLVTVASPHHGTALARLGHGANAREMGPSSDFLRALQQAERESPPTIPAISTWSPHDNMVMPQDTSRLPWARNMPIPGVGHLDILSSPLLHAVVVQAARQA
jgi:triacylglycerol lipase